MFTHSDDPETLSKGASKYRRAIGSDLRAFNPGRLGADYT